MAPTVTRIKVAHEESYYALLVRWCQQQTCYQLKVSVLRTVSSQVYPGGGSDPWHLSRPEEKQRGLPVTPCPVLVLCDRPGNPPVPGSQSVHSGCPSHVCTPPMLDLPQSQPLPRIYPSPPRVRRPPNPFCGERLRQQAAITSLIPPPPGQARYAWMWW